MDLQKHLEATNPFATFEAKLAELPTIAQDIMRELSSSEPFCLWMIGDLGAGKTTLTGAFLRSLGLDPDFPVTSPTFTYLNEYRIHDKWYAHIDLYRAGAGFTLEEFGIVDSRAFAGYFVEWPSIISDTEDVLPATHILTIQNTSDADKRSIKLYQNLVTK